MTNLAHPVSAVTRDIVVEDRRGGRVALIVIVKAVDPGPAKRVEDAQSRLRDFLDHTGLAVGE